MPTPENPTITIANDDLPSYDFEVTHYFREVEARYSSAFEYLVHRWLGIVHLLVWRDRLRTATHRSLKMFRHDRMKVLQAYADVAIDGDDDAPMSEFGLMTELHGPEWVRHSDSDTLVRYYELISQSLVATGDLERVGNSDGYRFTGRGMATLAAFETEDRRHRQNSAIQRTLAFLTVGLIIIGAAQVAVDLLNGPRTRELADGLSRLFEQQQSSDMSRP